MSDRQKQTERNEPPFPDGDATRDYMERIFAAGPPNPGPLVGSVDWGSGRSSSVTTVWQRGMDGRYRIVDSYTIGNMAASVPACQRGIG